MNKTRVNAIDHKGPATSLLTCCQVDKTHPFSFDTSGNFHDNLPTRGGCKASALRALPEAPVDFLFNPLKVRDFFAAP